MKSTLIRGLDENLWRKFKEICVSKDVSLNQKIKELIETYVKRNAKGE